ncbi:MAG: 4Fe-4S binding protein [Elusimicrobia bacterium]|nr:4Fe-4S binding protein [Elusimicrobiota bacterium]
MQELGRAAARWASARFEAPAALLGGVRAPVIRPPGARHEALFLALCTRCSDCVEACPHLVIRKAGPEAGKLLHGTPILEPASSPCLFCDGLPCAAACETGALRVPAGAVRIGTAAVDASPCLSAQDQPCDLCQQSCPLPTKAVTVAAGEPARVDAAACTGCGACAQACPPRAIRIEALS